MAGHRQAVALITIVALDQRRVLGDGVMCCRLLYSPFDIQLTPGEGKCMGKRNSTNMEVAKSRQKRRGR